MAFALDRVENYWAGGLALACLIAYFTRILTPNMFVLLVLAITAGRVAYESQ